jgi:hypothetical protein
LLGFADLSTRSNFSKFNFDYQISAEAREVIAIAERAGLQEKGSVWMLLP